jgi:Na+/H+ antiporter NhaD/arsenite permease-like protein
MVQPLGNTKGCRICVHGRGHLKYAHDTPTNYLELLICFLIVKLFNIFLYFSRMNYLPFQIGIVTFFLSAILDNLTSTIVMVSLLRKLVPPSEYRKYDFFQLACYICT